MAFKYQLQEQHLYGSSRLGIWKPEQNLSVALPVITANGNVLKMSNYTVGMRRYELSNHLGNVLAVITDRVAPFRTSAGAGVPDYYEAVVATATDYYAFGMESRTYTNPAIPNNGYRYGFNGKEDDDEWGKQDYGMRIYDTRAARFLSVDPIAKKYPELTPYQFASNTPIQAIDLDGLEKAHYSWEASNSAGINKIKSSNYTNTVNYQVYSFNSYFRQKGENAPYIYRFSNPNGATIDMSNSNLINTSLFKKGFDNYLPKRFLDHYALGSGNTYNLTEQEAADSHSIPVGLDMSKAGSDLNKININSSINIKGNVLSGSLVSGSLGNFTIEYQGKLTKNETGWSFDGQIRFVDFWYFDPRGPNTGRPASAETLVRIANSNLKGTPFRIESEWFNTKQDSSQPSFDWFNGKSTKVIPNNVTGNTDTQMDLNATTKERK